MVGAVRGWRIGLGPGYERADCYVVLLRIVRRSEIVVRQAWDLDLEGRRVEGPLTKHPLCRLQKVAAERMSWRLESYRSSRTPYRSAPPVCLSLCTKVLGWQSDRRFFLPATPPSRLSRQSSKKKIDNPKTRGWYTYQAVVAEGAEQGKTFAGEGGTLARRSLLQKVEGSKRSWDMGIG